MNATTTEIRPLLPDWHALHAAITSGAEHAAGEHPVIHIAHALAMSYRAPLLDDSQLVARQRAEYALMIDAWIALNACHSPAGPSIGSYVDQMASLAIEAERLLISDGPVGEPLLRAWWNLAALAAGWAELTDGLVAPYHG